MSDDREFPALVVAQRLVDLGRRFKSADPHVVEEHVDSRVLRVEPTADE